MKFIPCDEMSQIFSFGRTNRKAFYRDRVAEAIKREELKKQHRRKKK
jgi:hypothetical protein